MQCFQNMQQKLDVATKQLSKKKEESSKEKQKRTDVKSDPRPPAQISTLKGKAIAAQVCKITLFCHFLKSMPLS